MSASTTHPGDVYANFDRHLAEMRSRYAEQFAGPFSSCFWPDDWHAIVSKVCAHIALHRPRARWAQIQVKLGGLRMYASIAPEALDIELQDFVWGMTRSSLWTCGLCGGRSGLRGKLQALGG